MRGRTGFSLAEMLVGLVVLEVGLLGAAGMVVVTARIMAEAGVREEAVAAARGAADSLLLFGFSSPGEAAALPGRVRWRPAGGAVVEVAVLPPEPDTVPVFTVWLKPPTRGGGAGGP